MQITYQREAKEGRAWSKGKTIKKHERQQDMQTQENMYLQYAKSVMKYNEGAQI